jgi:hypothetical protein
MKTAQGMEEKQYLENWGGGGGIFKRDLLIDYRCLHFENWRRTATMGDLAERTP